METASRALSLRLFVIFLGTLISGCGIPPYDQGLSPAGNLTREAYTYQGDQILYTANRLKTDKERPAIVFIHGTPGSWHAFSGLLENQQLLERADLFAVDRPGFGRSAATGLVTTLSGQSEALGPLLDQITSQRRAPLSRAPLSRAPLSRAPLLIVGHSLGGSIAYQMAADHGDRIDGVIAVSASLDPKLGGPRWYNQLAAMFYWAVPSRLKAANREIMPLADALASLQARLETVNMPVTAIHGSRDRLVSVKHLDYVAARLSHTDLEIVRQDDAGHFLLWEEPQMVVDAIIRLLDRVNSTRSVSEAG